MNAALQEVKKTIEAKGGNFLLETNPEVLGENEKSVGEQLREARNKPEEEEQEDEEDNNQEQEEGIKPVNFEDNDLKITK